MEVTQLTSKGKGLINMGNMCYFNTAVQILSAIPEFQPKHPKSPLNQYIGGDEAHPLVAKWSALIDELQSTQTHDPIRPVQLVEYLAEHSKTKPFQINAREQQDAAECLQFLAEELHTVLAKPVEASVQGTTRTSVDLLAKSCYEMLVEIYRKSYSEFYPICYGVSFTTLAPLSTVTQSNLVQSDRPIPIPPPTPLSVKPESFFVLNCPLPSCPPFNKDAPVTLYQCLEQITRPEILEGDNAWFDEKLGYKRPVQKQTGFWNFPPILVIALQRICPDGTKDKRVVQYPILNLDLGPYMCGYGKQNAKYELFAVGLHHGDMYDGHYTAIVKKEKGLWIHYNDDLVQVFAQYSDDISSENVETEMSKNMSHPSVYLLVYRRLA